MVKGVVNGVETYYPGRHYNEEVDGSTSTVKKFYTLGSTTVAVRTVSGTEDVLNWVLGDHLGSASVTANADGSWNSEIKYTAFGEVRVSNGITPTEYRYTGQLEHSYIKLYWYRSRWFDNELGHFIQPDSIIPSPGDALSYDRYAYVKSNPINFTDPTGHYEFEERPDDQHLIPATKGIMPARRSTKPFAFTQDERRGLIKRKAEYLQGAVEDSLEAFGDLVDYASGLYDDRTEVNEFVLDLTCVINNYCIGHPLNVWKAGFGTKYPIGDPRYSLGDDFFEGQGSWSDSYFDDTYNQMYHVWFYVATSFFDTLPIALAGNYYHDPVYVLTTHFGGFHFARNDPLIVADNGISIEDFDLGYVGAYFGLQLRLGFIRPSGVGDWIKENLSQ
ncbi:MAG: RHS repeat-associated core domain-containing protein [Anaerolineaceae bacterium]|nr:RHS repeat-associated core domain-containing protein [Anaerolineaceae bacterium]